MKQILHIKLTPSGGNASPGYRWRHDIHSAEEQLFVILCDAAGRYNPCVHAVNPIGKLIAKAKF